MFVIILCYTSKRGDSRNVHGKKKKDLLYDILFSLVYTSVFGNISRTPILWIRRHNVIAVTNESFDSKVENSLYYKLYYNVYNFTYTNTFSFFFFCTFTEQKKKAVNIAICNSKWILLRAITVLSMKKIIISVIIIIYLIKCNFTFLFDISKYRLFGFNVFSVSISKMNVSPHPHQYCTTYIFFSVIIRWKIKISQIAYFLFFIWKKKL